MRLRSCTCRARRGFVSRARRGLASMTSLLCLLLVASLARAAEAKPAIAVLGLEVIDESGEVNEQATSFAQSLTEALRQQAALSAGAYALAPNSDKDLLEMKLLSSCADEGRGCMAEIGRELGAERLLYGKVEKLADGYQVSLKLLNATTEEMERTTTDIVPIGADLGDWGRTMYNRLTGVPEQGVVVVHANVERGTVYLDGRVATTLSAGSARITGVAEGQHAIRIESAGFEAHEGNVAVSGSETRELAVRLQPIVSETIATSRERPGGVSRVLFWTSLVATGASATAMTITGLQVRGSLEDDKLDALTALERNEGITLSGDDACSDAERLAASPGVTAVVDACEKGQSRAKLTTVLAGATIVSALAATFFYYSGYIASDSGSDERSASRERAQSPTVQFLPAIGPQSVSAGVKIEF